MNLTGIRGSGVPPVFGINRKAAQEEFGMLLCIPGACRVNLRGGADYETSQTDP
jgi:hypothetical protein